MNARIDTAISIPRGAKKTFFFFAAINVGHQGIATKEARKKIAVAYGANS